MNFRLRFAFLLLLITDFTTQVIDQGYSQSSRRLHKETNLSNVAETGELI